MITKITNGNLVSGEDKRFVKLSGMGPIRVIEIISATFMFVLTVYLLSQHRQTAKEMVLCQTRTVLLFNNHHTKQET
jgi:hypothetical protein